MKRAIMDTDFSCSDCGGSIKYTGEQKTYGGMHPNCRNMVYVCLKCGAEVLLTEYEHVGYCIVSSLMHYIENKLEAE